MLHTIHSKALLGLMLCIMHLASVGIPALRFGLLELFFRVPLAWVFPLSGFLLPLAPWFPLRWLWLKVFPYFGVCASIASTTVWPSTAVPVSVRSASFQLSNHFSCRI